MARIYALANQKGGVGKTTTAINLAACLAEAGERSLVVDLDPQANATSGLGMRANGTSSYDLLDGAPLADLTKPTQFPNLDIVPSKPELAGAVVELAQREDGERYLAEALASGTSQYDFVFLDCPPSLGPLTVNALAAADRVLVPVQAEYYALEGLEPADAVDRAHPPPAQPGPRHRRRVADDGRLAHAASRGRRGGGPQALRPARLPHVRPALGAARRSAEPRIAGDCLRPPLRRSRGVLEGGDGACRARTNRRGLGRGLEVLVGGTIPRRELLELPVDAIHPNPRQPRKRFDGEAAPGSRSPSSARASSSRCSCARGRQAATS